MTGTAIASVLGILGVAAVVAPEYLHYVDADPALTPEQRQRRHATVDRWAEAIAVREKAATNTRQ